MPDPQHRQLSEDGLAKVSFVNRATRESAKQQLGEISGLSAEGGNIKEPSAETKKLIDSVNEYQEFQKKLNERLDRKPGEPGYSDFGSVIGVNDMFKMKAMLNKIDEQALRCGEMPGLSPDESSFVAGVTSFTSKVAHVPREIDAEEQETVAANERQAMEPFNRRMVKEFEDKARQEGGPALLQH